MSAATGSQDPTHALEGAASAGLDVNLESNLCALLESSAADTKASEALIKRVLVADRGNHVIIGGPNPPLYRAQGRLREFVVHESELANEVRDIREDEQVFVFGIGLGEQVAHLLRTRPHASLVVWDRDPWMMRLALSKQDYSNSIRSKRLRFALGADLVRHLPRLHEMRLVVHPGFRGIYRDELRLVSEAISGSSPSEGRRWIGLGMGGVIVDDIAEGLRDEGWSVFPLEVTRWDPTETRHALEVIRPDRVVTVNYDDDVAQSCAALEIPLIVWAVDPSTDRTPTPPSAEDGFDLRVFTPHVGGVKVFEDEGFGSVEALPLGVDVYKRRPLELNEAETLKYAAPVSFVGSSLVDRAARFRRLFLQLHASFDCNGDETFDETEERLERVLAKEREDYSRFVGESVIEDEFGEFLEAAQRSGTPDDPKKWLGEIVASDKRIAYVTALADEGIHVWGDDGWSKVATEHPRLCFRGAASYGHELTLVYNAADIHVDVNRIYQADVVPIRVFDVLACGGFLIAEHSDALEELFQVGEELESYRTLSELEEKVAHYRAHPDERDAIARRGRKAVETRHTMRMRIKELVRP